MRPGKNLVLGIPVMVLVFALGAVVLFALAQFVDSDESASAETAAEEDAGGVPGGPVSITVVAKESRFDKRTITASAGAEVTVTLDNQDSGLLHNIAFYPNRNSSSALAQGKLVSGPTQDVLKFTAPSAAGNYFFKCDAHPDSMTGSLTVR